MGKYEPLQVYLMESGLESISLSFMEIEAILGCALPDSAYEHRQWWGNGSHSQAKAWLNAGYVTAQVSSSGGTVTFQRQGE